MTIWLPITIVVSILMLGTRFNKLTWFFFLSTLTGASVVSIGEKGIQPLYFIAYGMMYVIILKCCLNQIKVVKIQFPLLVLFLFSIFTVLISFYSTPINISQSIYVLSISIVTLDSYLIAAKMNHHQVTKTILYVSIFIFIYGLIDICCRYLNLPSLQNIFVNNKSVMDNTWANAYGMPRATSVFPEPSYLGAFSAVILLFCLSSFKTNKETVLLKFTIILSALNLYLTASFTGYSAFIVGLIYLFVMTMFSRSVFNISVFIKNFVLLVVFSLFLFLAFIIIFPTFMNELNSWIFARMLFEDDSILMRTSNLIDGYHLMKTHPFTGVGIGNFTSPDLMSTIAATTGMIGISILTLWFLFPILKGLLYALRGVLSQQSLPFFLIIFTIFFLFASGLGHTIILWPWVLVGVSMKLCSVQ